MRHMTVEEIVNSEEVRSVVDDYRDMCFWSMDCNFRPGNEQELLVMADCLDNYGDMAAYRRSGRIRQWLSQATKQAS